jgi:hypothetical protein
MIVEALELKGRLVKDPELGGQAIGYLLETPK